MTEADVCVSGKVIPLGVLITDHVSVLSRNVNALLKVEIPDSCNGGRWPLSK